MGTRIEVPEIEYGNDCAYCTVPNHTRWESGETPAFTYVYFTGIISCDRYAFPMPNGRIFKLTQEDPEFCRWTYDGPSWQVRFWAWNPFVAASRITLVDENLRYIFDGEVAPCPSEYTIFSNQIVDCGALRAGHSGFATVSWMELAKTINDDLVLYPNPRLMYEHAVHPDSDIVHKYCDKRDASNVKIKYSFD